MMLKALPHRHIAYIDLYRKEDEYGSTQWQFSFDSSERDNDNCDALMPFNRRLILNLHRHPLTIPNVRLLPDRTMASHP